MYPQFSPWGYNPWSRYPRGAADYFQTEWIPLGPMYRKPWHEKRAIFDQKIRPRDAIVIRGSDEKPASGISNMSRRHNADGIIHIGGQKFKWMPINRKSHKEAHATTVGRNRSPMYKTDGRHGNGGRKQNWVPVKRVGPKPIINSDDVGTAHALKLGEGQSAGGAENSTKENNADALGSGSVQKIEAGTKDKYLDCTSVASSSGSKNTESVNLDTDPAMRSSSSRTSTRWSPVVFGTYDQYGNQVLGQVRKMELIVYLISREISRPRTEYLSPE